jgi:hypothetical protein
MKASPIDELNGYKPSVSIDIYATIFQFRGDVHIMNPFDSSIDSIVIQC